MVWVLWGKETHKWFSYITSTLVKLVSPHLNKIEIKITIHCEVLRDLQRKRIYKRHCCSYFISASIYKEFWCCCSEPVFSLELMYLVGMPDRICFNHLFFICLMFLKDWDCVGLLEWGGEVLFALGSWDYLRQRRLQRLQWEASRRIYEGEDLWRASEKGFVSL